MSKGVSFFILQPFFKTENHDFKNLLLKNHKTLSF